MLKLINGGKGKSRKHQEDFRDRMALYWDRKQKRIMDIITLKMLYET